LTVLARDVPDRPRVPSWPRLLGSASKSWVRSMRTRSRPVSRWPVRGVRVTTGPRSSRC